jgi:hypothetical protein
MNARQGALAGLADTPWRPACVDDQRVNHGVFPSCPLAAFAADRVTLSIRSKADL